jgi:hypothetical protein
MSTMDQTRGQENLGWTMISVDCTAVSFLSHLRTIRRSS